MAEGRLPQDQGLGAERESRNLFRRRSASPLGSPRRPDLGRRGETPVVQATGARYGMSLISAVTARGHMRFMIKEKGGVNADVSSRFSNVCWLEPRTRYS